MSYKGRYTPQNPSKYKGDYRNIIYRSLWERKFMVYCDQSNNIIEWGSEEIIIPYLSPLDGRIHRYFPDFYIKKIFRFFHFCKSLNVNASSCAGGESMLKS